MFVCMLMNVLPSERLECKLGHQLFGWYGLTFPLLSVLLVNTYKAPSSLLCFLTPDLRRDNVGHTVYATP